MAEHIAHVVPAGALGPGGWAAVPGETDGAPSSSGTRPTSGDCLTSTTCLRSKPSNVANTHDARRVGADLVLLGSTDAGRWLDILYEQKPGGVVRVYHAREMNSKERRIYRRWPRQPKDEL
jgi:hypothetical protein